MKNKKGFTLIELLAIIVILAIIAVITVPIILNIIDNSKKGAAQNSAHGYKDAVQKYMVSKFSEDSSYRLPNGAYDVNSNGYLTSTANGTLDFEVSGNAPDGGYLEILNNKVASGCLKFGDYNVRITNGEVGSATTTECQRIAASTLRGVSVAVGTESEDPVTTEHFDLSITDYRFTGADPENYILFNCDDYSNPTTSSCELWRIVSVEDDNLKIVKADSDDTHVWNTSSSSNWEESDLYDYLNGSNEYSYLDLSNINGDNIIVNNRVYFDSNSTPEDTRFRFKNKKTYDLIQPKEWYLGGVNATTANAVEAYSGERSNFITNYPRTVVAKVGLLYPTDYGFASVGCASEGTSLFNYRSNNDCANWLQSSNDEWFISPGVDLGSGQVVTYGTSNGNVGLTSDEITSEKRVRPVVYLIANIGLNGSGTESDPYKIVIYE